MFAFFYSNFALSNIDLLIPKSIQLSFVSQQNNINPDEITPETLYCIEVLQNIAHIQEKRSLTLEEIIMTMKVLVYLHTHDSPYQQDTIVLMGDKTICLPFSSQLFAEILLQNVEDEE